MDQPVLQFDMDECTEYQPLFDISQFLNLKDEEELPTFSSPNPLLYSLEKDVNILSSPQRPLYFEFNKDKQCYSNLTTDDLTGYLLLRPCLPHQLLEDHVFQKFQTDNSRNLFVVCRLGFEICFGTIADADDMEKKILKWFNHHIYETSFLVDIHDFNPSSMTRRMRTFCTIITRKENNIPTLKWKFSELELLQSH